MDPLDAALPLQRHLRDWGLDLAMSLGEWDFFGVNRGSQRKLSGILRPSSWIHF